MNIPNRKDIPVKDTWNLADMFSSDEAWLSEYESLKNVPGLLKGFEGTLANNAQRLLEYFKLEDELTLRLKKLLCYASCKSDEDTANSFYQDLKGKAIGVLTAVMGAAAFSSPEILSIGEDKLRLFIDSCPGLKEYKRSINKILRRAAHTLSGEAETLLAAAEEMASSPDNIGGVFRNADLKFPDVTDNNGNVHALTSGSFVPLLESPDRSFREKVFKTYYGRLGEFKNTAAAILDAQFKQLCFFSRARKFGSTLEAALFSNEVPVSVYMSLINSVHDNMDKMYRYVSLRKSMLNVSELHMYDVYTPLVTDAAQEISFEQSKNIVLEALKVLGDDYTNVLIEGFNNRWIDVYENVGKRSGAYSSDNSLPHPYVLLNHKDNLDSLFTLAHEMGHALHSYFSQKNQPASTADYVIFVAEVASTCNEILLMKHLLSETTDKLSKIYLINHFLDQFKGTVYRQTMFAEFELMLGKMSEQGTTLTSDELCKKYAELNKLYFGDDMSVDEEIALEWIRIPHFFYNYYVFQYATGFSAAAAIAERILTEGEPAVADYKRFLSMGGANDPVSLLKIAGVDMSTPQPVNSALKMFGELLDEMEELIK